MIDKYFKKDVNTEFDYYISNDHKFILDENLDGKTYD